MNELQDLLVLIKSRFPIVLIESHEEPRVLALLERSTNLDNTPLYTWSVTTGLRRRLRTETVPETNDLMMALRHIDKTVQNGVYVLLDAQPYLQDPINLRLIRQAIRDDNRLNLDDVERILEFKHQSLAANTLLHLELDCQSFAEVAGQANLKRWLA